jgi:hypothetical protein
MIRQRENPRELLKTIGAQLIRQKNHEVWRLPNGRTVVLAKTTSDRNCDKQQLRIIRREMAGI